MQNKVETIKLRDKRIYLFKSEAHFIDYIVNDKKILIAMNAEKIVNEKPIFKEIINQHIGYTDGIGTIMAIRQKGFDAVQMPGVEMWLKIIKRYYKTKSFYLIGSTDEIVCLTVRKLRKNFKGIKILNFNSGFVSEETIEKIKADIIEKKPDFIFCAMGSLRQEIFAYELYKDYPAIYMGLGGSFDIYSGKKSRAPKFFIKLKLEWFYRLMKEPTRITRQLMLIKFMFLYIFRRL